jgi:hypothetical protein
VQVIGQTQDLFDLQRILKRSETKLGNQAQQNMTRLRLDGPAHKLQQQHSVERVMQQAGMPRQPAADTAMFYKATCCHRWAVYQAASALRKHLAEYEALMAAMKRGAPVAECVQAIETA